MPTKQATGDDMTIQPGVGTQEEQGAEFNTPAATGKGARKPKKYTHTICETTMELDAEVAADMDANPDRYLSLPCSHCGGSYRIGEDGEMVWSGTKDPVTA